jgi:hypothetical protein
MQQSDLLSHILFFQNKESTLKRERKILKMKTDEELERGIRRENRRNPRLKKLHAEGGSSMYVRKVHNIAHIHTV